MTTTEIGRTELESGDVVELVLSGTDKPIELEVDISVLEPPFPPADVAERDDLEQLPGQYQVALEDPETRTRWCLSRTLTSDGLEGPIEADVKACIDIRYPPRYRWRGRGSVERLEVISRAE